MDRRSKKQGSENQVLGGLKKVTEDQAMGGGQIKRTGSKKRRGSEKRVQQTECACETTTDNASCGLSPA